MIKLEIDKYIGARIRERRLELTMSQKSLANAVGVSFQQIQHYEAGANGITAVRLFEIAKVLVSYQSCFRCLGRQRTTSSSGLPLSSWLGVVLGHLA